MNCQKHLFNLDPEVCYLNCAYMSPLMKSVEEAGVKGILRKQQPNKVSAADFFTESDELRKEFSKLVNAKDPNSVVIIPSVSYGFATVAKNLQLKAGDEIVVAAEQFPSNIYPWRRAAQESGATIVTVSPPKVKENRGKSWNEHILEAINSKTKLVACGNIHWADGTLFNLKAIRAKTREVGAWLVVDGTQSIGAIPFDIQEIQPDALIAAGYKSLMGPYSIGMAYYGPVFNDGVPVEENWINRYESQDFANLVNYNDHYQPGALRYEIGEHSNFILVPMLLEAVKTLNSWGVENVKAYCDELVDDSIQKLRTAGYLIEELEYRASNLFGIRLGEGMEMGNIKSRLQEAHIFVSYRGDSIRVSPNVYNDAADMEKLVEALI